MASRTPLALPVTSVRTGSVIMGEGQETDPVLLTRNLLLMAINNINYIRGLFREDYFSDMSFLALEMKIKMLMPMDAPSKMLVDWMEKGVCDALQKKYLKTFLFCIYEEDLILEEYAFSFSYTSAEEVMMRLSHKGIKKGRTTFTLNASRVTPHQMRSSACKMIRRLASLMRTWEPMPEERTILMKLLCYNDITPDDYEPPFIKMHGDNVTTNMWYRNIMRLENINCKHLVLLLKVKNAFQPYSNDNNLVNRVDGMSLDDELDYNYFSNIELPKRSGFVLVSSSKKIEFILDSGATHHICNDKTMMRNLKHVKAEDQISVYSCGGIELKAEMMGSVITKNFKLGQVGFIPGMAFNVVSIGQLASQGLLITIADRQFSIIAIEDARLVGEGFLQKKKDRLNGTEHHECVFRTMVWDVQGDKNTLLDSIHEGENLLESEEWVIDTGCVRHMVPDLSILSNPKQEKVALQSASGTIWTTHRGSIKEGN